MFPHVYLYDMLTRCLQIGKGAQPTCDTLADAGTSVDVGDQVQTSQHVFLPEESLGLVRLER